MQPKKSIEPSEPPLIQFSWRRPFGGVSYRWIDGLTGPELAGRAAEARENARFLLLDPDAPKDGKVEQFNPLVSHPALFRTFAELKPTEEAILHFANRYGRLGVDEPAILPGRKGGVMRFQDGKGLHGAVHWGERREPWIHAVDGLRAALEIADAVHERHERVLAAWFRIERKGNDVWAGYERDGSFSRIADNRVPARDLQARARHLRDGGLRRVALFFLQERINKQLAKTTTSRLLYVPKEDQLRLHTTPENLLGAMWIQLARFVEGEREHKRCPECGNWFEVSLEPEGYTQRREFCRQACRFRAYRRRQTRARELAATGRPLKAIAVEVGSDITTVRRWVGELDLRSGRSVRTAKR